MRNNRFAAAVADDDDFPTCPGCNKQVWPSERSLKAMGGTYHTGCIKCTTCAIQLTPRMMDTYQGKPYCASHLPTTTGGKVGAKLQSTAVADDVLTKHVTSVPNAVRRQPGVNVAASREMVSGENLDRNRQGLKEETWEYTGKADVGEYVKNAEQSYADTSGSGERIGQAQSGEFVSEPRGPSTADTSYTGERVGQSESGEFSSQPNESQAHAGTNYDV